MGRPLDFTALTPAERAVLVSATLLFLNGLVPWWYRTAAPSGTYRYNAGLTGFGTVAMIAAAVAAITVLVRTAIWPEPAPARDGLVYSGLGLVATVALAAQILTGVGAWIGLYVALALAIALTAAGVARRAERRRGWA